MLLLSAIAAGYVAMASWPTITLGLSVKNALEDALPGLYRANLLPEPDATDATERLRLQLVKAIGDLGVVDPETAVTFTRDARTVSIQAAIDTAIDLKILRKSYPVRLRPRVETSSAHQGE